MVQKRHRPTRESPEKSSENDQRSRKHDLQGKIEITKL